MITLQYTCVYSVHAYDTDVLTALYVHLKLYSCRLVVRQFILQLAWGTWQWWSCWLSALKFPQPPLIRQVTPASEHKTYPTLLSTLEWYTFIHKVNLTIVEPTMLRTRFMSDHFWRMFSVLEFVQPLSDLIQIFLLSFHILNCLHAWTYAYQCAYT